MKKYLIIVIFLFGCNTAQRKLEKTQMYLFKHPEFSAGYCAEQFPDKADSVIIRTDTIIEPLFLDSLVYETDSLYFDTSNCKPKIYIKKITVRKDSIIYRENTAEQHRLQLALLSCQDNNNTWLQKYTNLEAENAIWRGRAKTRWLWIALLIGGAVAYTGFKVYSKFKV